MTQDGVMSMVDKNIYKSINLCRADFCFACEFKIPSKVDKLLHLPKLYILHNSEFRIPKFAMQMSAIGIRNSEFGIRNCEVV